MMGILWWMCPTINVVFVNLENLFWTFSIYGCLSNCSSISAILSTIIGVHFGHVLVHFKVGSMNSCDLCLNYMQYDLSSHLILSNYYRVIQLDWSIGFWWVLLSSFQELSFISLMVWTECSIYANYLLSPCFLMLFPNAAIPLNKQLYTFSYVCVTSGAAALVFSALYIMVCFFFPHEISFFFHINRVIIDLLVY